MPEAAEWFCALLDEASEVYFRFAIEPEWRLAYVSPSVEVLTGRSAAEFYANPGLCSAVVMRGERHLLRRALRSRRSQEMRLHLMRDGVAVPVVVRTVGVVRNGRLVATEGVARLARARRSDDGSAAGSLFLPGGSPDGASHEGPVQQRLAALMFEVHALLHQVLPPRPAARVEGKLLTLGELVLDVERLTVTESGQPVPLTTREVLLLRYLLQRPGRVVTRQQLLTDVWDYRFTGDDRTVDVHVSRLRKKLPSLKGRLVAIRNIGYRIDEEAERKLANG